MAIDRNSRSELRVVFMGTPAFAVPALDALSNAGCDVVGVCTQPDRQSGRGRRLTPPPVKQAAIDRSLSVFQPASLRQDDEARQRIAALEPDLIVVVAYGLFLPADTLAVPPLGALNLHPSLLPRHRGPSPVATAILQGDATTGVTLMQLDEGMDSGPIISQRSADIRSSETAEDLTERLFEMGADLLAETIPAWRSGKIDSTPQNETEATVTRLLKRDDGAIDWTRPAAYIALQLRAFHPWPGSFTHWNGRQLKLHWAAYLDIDAGQTAGEVIAVPQGIAVTTGDGALLLRRVQIEGRQATDIADFARGYRDFVGSRLGAS